MRILLTAAGRTGHVLPLVPFARRLIARGHEVIFVIPPDFVDMVEALGFVAVGIGENDAASFDGRRPVRPFDEGVQRASVQRWFGDAVVRQRFGPLVELGTTLRPDIFLCEEMDYAGMLAAERLGLPFATLLLIATGIVSSRDWIAPGLDPVRAELGFDPDPDLLLPGRHLVLSPFPARFADPAPALAGALRRYRPKEIRRGPSGAGPLVYATLGTDFNTRSGDLFERLIAGLSETGTSVVLAVGENIDPATLGPTTERVRVERFVDQDAVLASCDLVVSHAGSGTMLSAMATGVPMLLLPLGADQPYNAERCRQLGIARVLDPVSVTASVIEAEASGLLSDRATRAAAADFARTIAMQPPLETAVDHLLALAQ